MPSFLQLCQDYRADVGIPGNGPATVVNQTGELYRVVKDIRDADLDIRRRWQDWDFNWAVFNTFTVKGTRFLKDPKPFDIGAYDTRSAWLYPETKQAAHLAYWPHEEFRHTLPGEVQPAQQPSRFSIRPDKVIMTNRITDFDYPFQISYWKKAVPMTADATVSPIPEEFHRIIVVRAKIMYAEREDAPEIMAGATAEWTDLLLQLEGDQSPGKRSAKQSVAVEPLTVRPE